MTKKLISFVLILAFMIPVFAANNYAGISVGADFDWITRISVDGPDRFKVQTNTIGLAANVEGANYFGSFGVGYKAGVSFPMSKTMKKDGVIYEGADSKIFFLTTIWNFQVSGKYKHDFNENLALEAGLGVGYSFGTKKAEDLQVNIMQQIIAITGEIGVMYEFTDSIALRGGLDMGVPVYSTIADITPGSSKKVELESTIGFTMTPYIGVVYTY